MQITLWLPVMSPGDTTPMWRGKVQNWKWHNGLFLLIMWDPPPHNPVMFRRSAGFGENKWLERLWGGEIHKIGGSSALILFISTAIPLVQSKCLVTACCCVNNSILELRSFFNQNTTHMRAFFFFMTWLKNTEILLCCYQNHLVKHFVFPQAADPLGCGL